MILRSRIEAAERRVEEARVQVGRDGAELGRAVHRRVCSPQAHLVALGAGFVWGLGPWGRDGGGREHPQVKAIVGFAARAALTRVVTGLFV